MTDETGGCAENADSVFHAATEIDGRCFFEISGRAGDFSDAEAEHYGLGDHLVIEDKVVGVFKKWEGLKQFS